MKKLLILSALLLLSSCVKGKWTVDSASGKQYKCSGTYITGSPGAIECDNGKIIYLSKSDTVTKE